MSGAYYGVLGWSIPVTCVKGPKSWEEQHKETITYLWCPSCKKLRDAGLFCFICGAKLAEQTEKASISDYEVWEKIGFHITEHLLFYRPKVIDIQDQFCVEVSVEQLQRCKGLFIKKLENSKAKFTKAEIKLRLCFEVQ
jgi:hypothetical protein